MFNASVEMNELLALIRDYPPDKSYSLAILQDIQRKFGYVPRECFEPLAEYLEVKVISLYSMATFYKSLRLKPKGKHIIKVCDGTACHIRGPVTLLDALKQELHVDVGETTDDGLFTFETVNCVGACAISPVMVVDERYYPKVTPEQICGILDEYRGWSCQIKTSEFDTARPCNRGGEEDV